MSGLAQDTQGNVLRGYSRLQSAAYVFAEIPGGGADGARALLAALAAEGQAAGAGNAPEPFAVMSGAPWTSAQKQSIEEALNVAFTYRGLEKLGWAGPFDRFTAFREGMRARAAHLRDSRENAPELWEEGLRGDPDLLFALFCGDPARRDRRAGELQQLLEDRGLTAVIRQDAGTEATEGESFREHFGFRDGFSQPAIEGAEPREDPRGEGVIEHPWSHPYRWRALRAGEFLLGHADEDGPPQDDDLKLPLRNGTFMAWRKLEQDVEGFREYVRETSLPGEDQAAAAARIVGRWPDGTSLDVNPDSYPAVAEPRPANDFSYTGDPHGSRCPVGAHVRRANPRSTLKWGTERTRRHRLIRRGLPYADGERSVGLIFVCFNASLERQFELVQGQWLMDGDSFGLGSEQDVLLGTADSAPHFTVPGQPGGRPARLLPRPRRQLVRTRGGFYLFMPGMAGLREIAKGPPPADTAQPPPAAASAGPRVIEQLAGAAMALWVAVRAASRSRALQ